MNHPKYRADIDGLRAIAVLAVVAYHAGITWLSGGFVGVDVFFVISGFLITGIVARDIRRGTFSILTFYERRARRIFPALFAMLAACVVAGAVFLMPRAFQSQFDSLLPTVFFWSNFHFWIENSNYFSGASELMPLLHTWSLAVEEQFYIFFPPLLYAVIRFRERALMPVLLFSSVGSLVLAEFGTQHAPTLTFFAFPTRAWELLLGSALALGGIPTTSDKRVLNTAGIVGLVLIAWSVSTYSTETRFPGFSAIAPCLGAALLIWSGQDKLTWSSKFLGLKPLVGIGLISYSLYLWHWPVLAFAKHQQIGTHLSYEALAGLLAFAFILAWLSWRFIEQPFRKRSLAPNSRSVLIWSVASMFVLAAFAIGGSSLHGWKSRFPGYEDIEAPVPSSLADELSGCFVLPGDDWASDKCFMGGNDTERPNAMLVGDSHAMHLVSGLSKLEASSSHDILVRTKPSCPPVLGYHAANNPECYAFNAELESIASKIRADVLIFSGAWWAYVSRHRLSVKEIAAGIEPLCKTRKCVVLGQSPSFNFEYPDEYFFAAYAGKDSENGTVAELAFDPVFNVRLEKAFGDIIFISLTDLFCNGRACQFRAKDEFLFTDGNHFSSTGSTIVAPEILNAFLRMR